MPDCRVPLRRLGLLTVGPFDAADPERAEDLGFDSVWVRQRHFQSGISSPSALLAAARQRIDRIALGTTVIPLAWENPLRLAEDLATVDVRSGGRLNPGVSVGTPFLYKQFKTALYPETHNMENLPFNFAEDDYVQIITDMATELGPRLGWRPDQSVLSRSAPNAPQRA